MTLFLSLYKDYTSRLLRPHLISDAGMVLEGILVELLLLTRVLCNILLWHDVLGSLRVQQIGFYAVISLEVVALVPSLCDLIYNVLSGTISLYSLAVQR